MLTRKVSASVAAGLQIVESVLEAGCKFRVRCNEVLGGLGHASISQNVCIATQCSHICAHLIFVCLQIRQVRARYAVEEVGFLSLSRLYLRVNGWV